MKIIGIIFLFIGVSLFIPSYTLMNDDLRHIFCNNHSIDQEDYKNCYETVQKDSLRNNGISSIIIIIGAVIMIMSSFPNAKGNDSRCQKCGKDYGFGFIYLPNEKWNVKETKVCKLCYKEIEKAQQSTADGSRK